MEVFSFTDGDTVIYVINTDNDSFSTSSLSFTVGGLVNSMVTSSDGKMLYLARRQPKNVYFLIDDVYLDIYNISALPSVQQPVNSLLLEGYEIGIQKAPRMILASNDQTLLIPNGNSTYVIDVSDPANCSMYLSRISSGQYQIAASSDGSTVFISSENQLKALDLYCNFHLKDYLMHILDFDSVEDSPNLPKIPLLHHLVVTLCSTSKRMVQFLCIAPLSRQTSLSKALLTQTHL